MPHAPRLQPHALQAATPCTQVGVLSSHAQQQRTSYAIHPLWLVFMDPRVQVQHEATFYPARQPYMNSTVNLSTCLIWLVCIIAIFSNDPIDNNLHAELSRGTTDTRLLLGVMAWSLVLFLLWHSALARRFRKTVDVLFYCSANLSVCLEIANNCYITNSGEGNCRDAESRLELSDSRLGLEHLHWFDNLILFIPVIFANLSFPWSTIVLGHVAATLFIWQYLFHEYTPEEIGNDASFSMNLKMARSMSNPILHPCPLTTSIQALRRASWSSRT